MNVSPSEVELYAFDSLDDPERIDAVEEAIRSDPDVAKLYQKFCDEQQSAAIHSGEVFYCPLRGEGSSKTIDWIKSVNVQVALEGDRLRVEFTGLHHLEPECLLGLTPLGQRYISFDPKKLLEDSDIGQAWIEPDARGGGAYLRCSILQPRNVPAVGRYRLMLQSIDTPSKKSFRLTDADTERLAAAVRKIQVKTQGQWAEQLLEPVEDWSMLTEKDVRDLLAVLKNPQAEEISRMAAAKSLASHSDRQIGDTFSSLLFDVNNPQSVRIAAARALAHTGSGLAFEALLSVEQDVTNEQPIRDGCRQAIAERLSLRECQIEIAQERNGQKVPLSLVESGWLLDISLGDPCDLDLVSTDQLREIARKDLAVIPLSPVACSDDRRVFESQVCASQAEIWTDNTVVQFVQLRPKSASKFD